MFGHGAGQAVAGDMGIDLGCGDVGVTQHALDAAEVCSVFDQMCGEGVADNVGAEAFGVDIGSQREFLEELEEALAGNRCVQAGGRGEEEGGICAAQRQPFLKRM